MSGQAGAGLSPRICCTQTDTRDRDIRSSVEFSREQQPPECLGNTLQGVESLR